MRRAPVALASVALVVLVACESRESPPAARPSAPGPASGQAAPSPRAPTVRPGPRPSIEASGPARWLLARAVRDLRRLGLWEPLTRHLDQVVLSSHPGRGNIPDDEHLADAFLGAVFSRRGSGAGCDIHFYPAAIALDLRRQAAYHADGALSQAPPSARQFWVALLGHELGHCLPPRVRFRQRGERTAERWEKRVLEAARSRL